MRNPAPPELCGTGLVPVLVPERLKTSPLSVALSVLSRCVDGLTPEVRVELTRGCPHRILSSLPYSRTQP